MGFEINENFISWEVSFSFLVLIAMVGSFIDYALHKSYTPKVKTLLLTPFLYLDNVKIIEIIYKDTQKVILLLNRIFGSSVFSKRLLIVSIASGAIGYFSLLAIKDHLWLDDLHVLPDYDPFFDPKAQKVVFLAVFFLNILTDQISLKLSKWLLALSDRSLAGLLSNLIINILTSLILGFSPIYIAFTIFAVCYEGKPYFEALGTGFEYIIESLMAPISYYFFPVESYFSISRDVNAFHIPWLMFSILVIPITASLATIFCSVLIFRDLVLKLFIQPLAYFMAALIDSLEKEERPVLKVFGFIGGIPLLLKTVFVITGYTYKLMRL